jgi:polysaccharide export outer membrane protein
MRRLLSSLPRFTGCLAAVALAAVHPLAAEEAESGGAAPQTEVKPSSSWRESYTFGPGDVVNFAFYGKSTLDRQGNRIAPDGTLSYLQANSIDVDGLTIDEIRERFETYLTSYYRNIRLIVTPGELKSKRYIILGKVMDKGVFTLDRPMTVLEAIARSRGIETGLFEQRTVEVADLDRSFIIRNGERLDADLGALYYRGDLSQNVQLEPDDYIYIASNLTNEFYVLGAVSTPGTQGLTPSMTVVGAVTRREGFTENAWKQRVLLVRGSIGNPTTEVIDVKAILQGRAKDVRIEPGDIIYVHDRPWKRVEQLLDRAIMDYLRSATATWTSTYVPAITEEEWLPDPNWKTWPWEDE